MDTEELAATLEAAGLAPYEAAAYVALLDLGAASATRVADRSDVPPPRIYDVLRSLEEEGYVELYDQQTLRARAHSPADVTGDLRARAERFEAAAEEVEDRWEQPDLESKEASIVSRFQTVLDHAKRIVEGAETRVQVAATPEQFEELRPWLAEAHDRGVNVRVAIHSQPDDGAIDADQFEGVCEEARHRAVPGPFVTLVDQTNLCFSPHEATYGDYGVLVDDQAHAYIFHWFYLTSLWIRWETIYSARTDELPVTYVDIRHCVEDVEPLLEEGATVHVSVTGNDVETGEHRELSGTIVDIAYADARDTADDESLLRMAGQVTIRLATDDGEYDVGGWAAVLEDVSADEITVERVDHPGETAV